MKDPFMKKNLSLFIALYASLGSSAFAAPVPTTNQLVDSIGINTHVGRTATNDFYANTANTQYELWYLGIRHVRDTFSGRYQIPAMQQIATNTGVKYDIIVQGDTAYATQMSDIKANIPLIDMVEGPNEVDNWPFSFNALYGFPAAIALQQNIYNDIHNDSRTATIPVASLTVANQSSLLSVGDLSAMSDYGNVHSYLQWGGYWGAFCYPSLQWGISTFGVIAKSKPAVVTETGWWTAPSNWGVTENVQAKFTLTQIFDSLLQGVKRTYFYQLNDEYSDSAGTNIEDHFGLFNYTNTPKKAATTLHNIINLLGYTPNQPAFAANSFNYNMSGLPANSGHYMLFQKQNNVFVLAIWNEIMFWDNQAHVELQTATTPVTINFGTRVTSVQVYDPLVGTSAVNSFSGVTNAAIAVPDHPVLVFITQ